MPASTRSASGDLRLAADIGGTKTLLALYRPSSRTRRPVRQASLPTGGFESAAALIAAFLDGQPIERATIAVAGAVIDETARGSNLPWDVTAGEIPTTTPGGAELINDLHAIATFIPRLRGDDVETLHRGERERDGAIGVIAPGTGIGQAMLLPCGGALEPARSEAGHIDFAPNGPLQLEYLQFLADRYGHVSLERACSGSALPNLYEFITRSEHALPDSEVRAAVAASNDVAATITAAALEERCAACELTLETFVSILGAAAGNLALQIVATGGIYIAGGIPPRILPFLRRDTLLDAFFAKGRFEHLVRRIPVLVVLEPRAALYGAATRLLAGST